MYGSTAARVREAKERRPQDFCRVPSCLWRTVTATGSKPCKKHPMPVSASVKPETPRAIVLTEYVVEIVKVQRMGGATE